MARTDPILACDVGGTKTNLALLEPGDGPFEVRRFETYRSRDYDSLYAVIDAFLGDGPPQLSAAGFGVAGPVIGGKVRTTNLPWLIEGDRLAERLDLPRVALLNDVAAIAWSVDRLRPEDVLTLRQGELDEGNRAVVAAGTGLGLSALVRSEDLSLALHSEGGHADYAPRTEVEVAFFEHQRARYGHVSSERVLSGPGFVDLYHFLRERAGHPPPDELAEALRGDDPAPAITEAAQGGRCPVCEETVDVFLGIYGAEAGNWALRVLASGGVYLGGGIAAKQLCGPDGVREEARDPLVEAFLDKGRMRPLLEKMSLRVITEARAPLFGAAAFALRAAHR